MTFRSAAANGHIEMINLLLTINPNHTENFIYEGFIDAVHYGHIGLAKKYGLQFSADPSFEAHIRNRFELTDEDDSHGRLFAAETDLEGLLSPVQPISSPGKSGFFSASEATSTLESTILAAEHQFTRLY